MMGWKSTLRSHHFHSTSRPQSNKLFSHNFFFYPTFLLNKTDPQLLLLRGYILVFSINVLVKFIPLKNDCLCLNLIKEQYLRFSFIKPAFENVLMDKSILGSYQKKAMRFVIIVIVSWQEMVVLFVVFGYIFIIMEHANICIQFLSLFPR